MRCVPDERADERPRSRPTKARDSAVAAPPSAGRAPRSPAARSREDADPDREARRRPSSRARGSGPCRVNGRVPPLGRGVAHDARRSRAPRPSERDRADPVPATPARAPPAHSARDSHASQSSPRASTAKSTASCAASTGIRAGPRTTARARRPAPRGEASRAISQSASVASRDTRTAPRRGSRSTQERDGSRCCRRQPAPYQRRDDEPCEPVGREDGRGHDEAEHELDRGVRSRDRAEPPERAPARATRLVKPYGSPRRAGSPVSAIARESCVSSSSSVKIVGTGCREACQA